MVNKIKLIEKIEGEAKLNFNFNSENKIDFVDIEFLSTRNIETILEGKDAFDALIINPRVCGICGHAHLISTVKALENCYDDIQITKKAQILRELTLTLELIQNHFKWFYLTIMPLLGYKQYLLKATKPTQIISRAIAIVAGQYPHNSYAIVGGVTCDVTAMDIIMVKNYLDDSLKYFEENLIITNRLEFTGYENLDKLLSKGGDLPTLLNKIKEENLQYIGKSFDRFIVFGGNRYFKSGKSMHTRVNTNINLDNIVEFKNKNSYAKNVKYKDKHFEVGPLSRAMLNKTSLIKEAHRRYQDSIFTRILARTCEIPQLINHCKTLLEDIDLSQPSYIKPIKDISQITSSGVGIVEAARCSLIHKVNLENGVIKKYDIITPTQWNLSNGTREDLAISQKAMVGLNDIKIAELVFKSFDVCSVCTTH
jgi:hydrogenase large subunit